MILNSVINHNEVFKIEDLESVSIPFSKNNPNYNLKKYNSSHLVSFTGILFYIVIIAFVISVTRNPHLNESSLLFFIPLMILIYIFSRDMNYFEVSDTHLIIKNSIQFWKISQFQLNKIQSVEILNYYRKPGNNIVIKTKYFDVKTFHSDNLFDKEWNKFIEHLKSEQIQVIDKRNFSARQTLY